MGDVSGPPGGQERHEERFAAMGTQCHVVVTAASADLVNVARRRIAELETRWSRFRPDSEISRLNAGAGGPPRVVSADTFLLVSRAVEAWVATDGCFDPTVLDALVGVGYDRTFSEVSRSSGIPLDASPSPSPGCGAIEFDPDRRSVRLPTGVHLDLGGIAKGLAADLLVGELIAAGALGACVNLGGDVRFAGRPPVQTAGENAALWRTAVEVPGDPSRYLAVLELADGAVVTSSTIARRWRRSDTMLHHLIDPRTGHPTDSDVIAVTVVASRAWWAEALAKQVVVMGSDQAMACLERWGAGGVVVTTDGVAYLNSTIRPMIADGVVAAVSAQT